MCAKRGLYECERYHCDGSECRRSSDSKSTASTAISTPELELHVEFGILGALAALSSGILCKEPPGSANQRQITNASVTA